MSDPIKAPIGGVVFSVVRKAGEAVAFDDPVVVIARESGGQVPATASRAGVVAQVLVQPGQRVAEDDVLALLM